MAAKARQPSHSRGMLRPRALASSGLTLVELLIGIALLAVLMGLAVPSFQAQVASSQLTSATNALLGSLMQARAQAIRLGRRVTVCRTNDQSQCDTDTTRGWETGWLIFIDADRTVPAGTSGAQVSATDTILGRSEPLPPALRAVGNNPVSQYISFAASGEARTMGSGLLLGTIRICTGSAALADASRARELVLSAGGRIVSSPTPAGVAPTCPAP